MATKSTPPYDMIITIVAVCATANWVQVGNEIDGESPNDRSGRSVAMSSDGLKIAIGAQLNDGGGSLSGHVRIYSYNGESWIRVGSDIDGFENDQSGHSIAMSDDGTRVAVSAPLDDNAAGYVRVFDYDGTDWVQAGNDIVGQSSAALGTQIAMSGDGNRIAIATNPIVDGIQPGIVRVYDYAGGQWSVIQNMGGTQDDESYGAGLALSRDGNRLVIGSPDYDHLTLTSSGRVETWDFNGIQFSPFGSTLYSEADYGRFGSGVSISADGKRLAIGSPYYDSPGKIDCGRVQVFSLTANEDDWLQLGSDIYGEMSFDELGLKSALSSDGNRIVLGAHKNRENGPLSGHVRVYDYNGNDWAQKGNDIDGEQSEDYFGRDVAISDDGSKIVVGAEGSPGATGPETGHTKVFEFRSAESGLGVGAIVGIAVGSTVVVGVAAYFGFRSILTGSKYAKVDEPFL